MTSSDAAVEALLASRPKPNPAAVPSSAESQLADAQAQVAQAQAHLAAAQAQLAQLMSRLAHAEAASPGAGTPAEGPFGTAASQSQAASDAAMPAPALAAAAIPSIENLADWPLLSSAQPAIASLSMTSRSFAAAVSQGDGPLTGAVVHLEPAAAETHDDQPEPAQPAQHTAPEALQPPDQAAATHADHGGDQNSDDGAATDAAQDNVHEAASIATSEHDMHEAASIDASESQQADADELDELDTDEAASIASADDVFLHHPGEAASADDSDEEVFYQQHADEVSGTSAFDDGSPQAAAGVRAIPPGQVGERQAFGPQRYAA